MRIIPLTQGRYSVVDDDVYPMLSQFSWHVHGGYAYNVALGRLHRVVLAIHDRDECKEVDHKNGCPRDNRLENLRPATHAQNQRNKASRGYYWRKDRGMWQVQVRDEVGRQRHLGYYTDEEDAKAAATKAKVSFHGEYANDPTLRCPLIDACPECDARLPKREEPLSPGALVALGGTRRGALSP